MTQALVAAGEEAARVPLEEGVLVAQARIDSVAQQARLEPGDRELLHFVARVTLGPRTLRREHHSPLLTAGASEQEIFDFVQVISCFSYMNRLADALGVVLLPHQQEWAERLLGQDAVRAHLEWGRRRPSASSA